MTQDVNVEVVTYNIESVRIAARAGASRVELCANERAGGTSPSVAFLQTIKEEIGIPVFCMVRPREGDFIYNDDEVKIMLREIQLFKKAGADGIVCGTLTQDSCVDQEKLRKLMEAAYPLPFTFHRAFDFVMDPLESMRKIIECGCARILTSGQKKTAEAGMLLIKQLIQKAQNKIIILPGAGISTHNVQNIIEETGCREIHLSAKKIIHRNSHHHGIQLGSDIEANTYQQTDEDLLRSVMQIIREL